MIGVCFSHSLFYFTDSQGFYMSVCLSVSLPLSPARSLSTRLPIFSLLLYDLPFWRFHFAFQLEHISLIQLKRYIANGNISFRIITAAEKIAPTNQPSLEPGQWTSTRAVSSRRCGSRPFHIARCCPSTEAPAWQSPASGQSYVWCNPACSCSVCLGSDSRSSIRR